MTTMKYPQAQNPLLLRCHRLIEAFAKSDDERDFYLDRVEGFLVYVDLDKSEEELIKWEKELAQHSDRYCAIPKMTLYEVKKMMEGFANEKVYDIDTKEKLLEIIQAREARENFLEFIFDHHTELERWQQYYQERSRIRIIEWLRLNQFEFVFEEDLDLPKETMGDLKMHLFDTKVSKELQAARKVITAKARAYYSDEALNPRPKRGRPPKQVAKTEVEPQVAPDFHAAVPPGARPFLFLPEYQHGGLVSFSQKFENQEQFMARKRHGVQADLDSSVEALNQKLSAIRDLSKRWAIQEQSTPVHPEPAADEEPKKKESKIVPKASKSPPAKKSLPSTTKAPVTKKTLTPSKKGR